MNRKIYIIDDLSISRYLTEPFTTIIFSEWSIEEVIKFINHRIRKQAEIIYIGNHKNKEVIESKLGVKMTFSRNIQFNEKDVNRVIGVLNDKAHSILVKSSSSIQPRRY